MPAGSLAAVLPSGPWSQELTAEWPGFALLWLLWFTGHALYSRGSLGKEEVVGTIWPGQLLDGCKNELLWVHYSVQMKSTLWELLENVDLGQQPFCASFHDGRRQLQIIPLSQWHCPLSYSSSQNQHQLSSLAVEVPLDLLCSLHIS